MFLTKVGVKVETVIDGVECIDRVLGHEHGHYSLILVGYHPFFFFFFFFFLSPRVGLPSYD